MSRTRTPEQIDADFQSRISQVPTSAGCLEWTGTIERGGYGVVQIAGKQHRAHRYAFIRAGNVVADDQIVLHRCDNRKCCNVKHMYAGKQKDNKRDPMAQSHRGELNARARFSEDDVVAIRKAYANGETQVAIAARLKTTQGHISEICGGKLWSHLPK